MDPDDTQKTHKITYKRTHKRHTQDTHKIHTIYATHTKDAYFQNTHIMSLLPDPTCMSMYIYIHTHTHTHIPTVNYLRTCIFT